MKQVNSVAIIYLLLFLLLLLILLFSVPISLCVRLISSIPMAAACSVSSSGEVTMATDVSDLPVGSQARPTLALVL